MNEWFKEVVTPEEQEYRTFLKHEAEDIVLKEIFNGATNLIPFRTGENPETLNPIFKFNYCFF